MKTVVSSKGRIVLPAELRRLDGVETGQEFAVERLGSGDCRVVRQTADPNVGLVEWLMTCPHPAWFVPLESESTDSL